MEGHAIVYCMNMAHLDVVHVKRTNKCVRNVLINILGVAKLSTIQDKRRCVMTNLTTDLNYNVPNAKSPLSIAILVDPLMFFCVVKNTMIAMLVYMATHPMENRVVYVVYLDVRVIVK